MNPLERTTVSAFLGREAGEPQQRATEPVVLEAALERLEAERAALQVTLARTEAERLALQAMLEHKEAERVALQATLESKVEERTARLLEANDQIAQEFGARSKMELELRQAQRLEVVGRLAAGIAHEINTPVQFVSDSLEFIRDGIGDLLRLLDPGAAADAVDLPYLRRELPLAVGRALGGLERVTALVRSMRDHAHPDISRMTAIDLNEAIAGTLTIARSEYKYVAELETQFATLPPVTCFVGDFNQVIVNLIVNAAHAIADVVGTSGNLGRITVKTWCDDPDVVVAIEDTGGGIPDYIREYVFEPFFTTKELGKGTGQGLAIARTVIVEKHGGTLTFESTVGQGTRFLIRIPIAGIAAPEEAVFTDDVV